jgi:hypothetical protein
MVTVALRDCTYSATDEAQAASLANILGGHPKPAIKGHFKTGQREKRSRH